MGNSNQRIVVTNAAHNIHAYMYSLSYNNLGKQSVETLKYMTTKLPKLKIIVW